jgi:acyl carrier protein phosphodiesterase
MNFLAHIFLSGDDKDILIGNFIADHVKGSQSEEFSEGVREGIQLHRAIDSYTDSHPVVRNTKKVIRPVFGKYAPVVGDVYYDHFLARNWNSVSDDPLEDFVQDFYSYTDTVNEMLPERTRGMLSVMVRQNWLLSYRTIEGTGKILEAMSRRAAFKSNMEMGEVTLREHYRTLEADFHEFFPELQKFVSDRISQTA